MLNLLGQPSFSCLEGKVNTRIIEVVSCGKDLVTHLFSVSLRENALEQYSHVWFRSFVCTLW